MKKIIYLFSLCLIGYSASAQLSGTYSVYGTGAYAPSIQNACDSLMLHGQSGPVIFEIADNLMLNEAIVLTAVAGNSAANTITFTSASADSAKVSIASTTTSTFDIVGVDYISFTHLTIGYAGANGNTVSANSTDVSFDNVAINHTSAINSYAIYNFRDAGVNNFNFSNSNLSSTSGGIYLHSNLLDVKNTTLIDANIITSANAFNIYANKSLVDLSVSQSSISSSNNYAIYLQGYSNKIDGVTFENSQINAGTGIGAGNDALYAYSEYIAENFSVDNCTFNSANGDAFYIEVDYTRLNNVALTNSNFIGRYNGINLESNAVVSNVTIDNDTVVSNPADDINTRDEAIDINSDGLIDGISITNSFVETQGVYGNEAIELNSENNVNNVAIKNSEISGYAGVYIYSEAGGANWTIDSNTVYAESREAIELQPYYGLGENIAVNYNTITANNDDGIYLYSEASFKDVTLTNNVINADDHGMNIEGYYGFVDNVTITNNIDTAGSDGVYIFSYNLKNATISDNFIESGSDGIEAYGDYTVDNVTISENHVNAISYGIYVESDDGTIAGLTIENDSIWAKNNIGIYAYAESQLNNVEINNNVIDAKNGMDLEGYYGGINNMSLKKNIVDVTSYGIYIFSYALNNVNVSDSNYVSSRTQALAIYGDYSGIDGLNIEDSYFYSSTKEGGYIYVDYSNIENMNINNNTFYGDTTLLSGDYGLEIESDDSGMENVDITNNNIYGSDYGLYIEADYGNAKNTNITNNSIWSDNRGVSFDGIGDNSSVSNNSIYNLNGRVPSHGIYTYGYDGSSKGVTISGNNIEDATSYGLFIEYSEDVAIENNKVRLTGDNNAYGLYAQYIGGDSKINGNQFLADTASYGIYFEYSQGTSTNPIEVSNNFISGARFAFYTYDLDFVNLYHNSVASFDNNSEVIYIDNTTNMNIANNLIQVDSTSSGEIYWGDTDCANISIEDNVYDFDSTMVNMSNDAFFGANASLYDFQAGTTHDANSFMADPMFVNDTTDLHIDCTNNTLVTAPFIAGLTTDVDGTMRNTTATTFGAHEITPSGADILANSMVFCNSGTIIPNVTGAAYLWSPGGATTPTLTVTSAGTYDLQLTDFCGNVYNESIVVTEDLPVASFTTVSGGSIYIFTNTSTNATSYSWDFGDGNTSTATNPTHTYASTSSTYTVTLIATNACGTHTETFTAVTVDVPENLEARGLNIYPNPVNENLTLDFGLLIGEDISIDIFDIQGRVLISDQINGQSGAYQKTINVNGLTDGIYFVRLSTIDEVVTKKIIKN